MLHNVYRIYEIFLCYIKHFNCQRVHGPNLRKALFSEKLEQYKIFKEKVEMLSNNLMNENINNIS